MLATMPRSRVPEVMDQPGLSVWRHEAALRGLARINFFSASAGILWRPLASDLRKCGDRPYRILDVACGGGDVTMRLGKIANRRNLQIQIDGCDVSDTALQFARRRSASPVTGVQFFQLDVLRDPIPAGYDAVVCSLFLHHLDETDAVELLRRLASAANRLVLVNDLARGRTGYLLARFATKVLTRSDVVHFDGPVSVHAAFTPTEALSLAHRAGLIGATVTRHWPCRFLLTWNRHDETL